MDLLEFSHMPPLQSDWNVMTVLCEEIVKNAHGTTEEKTIHPTWLMSIASVSTIGSTSQSRLVVVMALPVVRMHLVL